MQEISSLSFQRQESAVTEAATTSTSVEHSSTSNKYNSWESFDSIIKESQTSQEAVDATLQGRHYVEETILPRRDDSLRWWRD